MTMIIYDKSTAVLILSLNSQHGRTAEKWSSQSQWCKRLSVSVGRFPLFNISAACVNPQLLSAVFKSPALKKYLTQPQTWNPSVWGKCLLMQDSLTYRDLMLCFFHLDSQRTIAAWSFSPTSLLCSHDAARSQLMATVPSEGGFILSCSPRQTRARLGPALSRWLPPPLTLWKPYTKVNPSFHWN